VSIGAVASAQDKSELTGTWKYTATDPTIGRPTEHTLKLKRDGEKVSGSLTIKPLLSRSIEDGTIRNGQFSFITREQFWLRLYEFKYSGKVVGGTLKGTVEVTVNGRQESITEWAAKRAK
jgi:hypothetical protein